MGLNSAVPVLVGPFSGPIHGLSIINNKLRDVMRERGMPYRTIDLSPGQWRRGPGYHLTRAGRTVLGLLHTLVGPLASKRRRYVMSVDGGPGLAHNIALALA